MQMNSFKKSVIRFIRSSPPKQTNSSMKMVRNDRILLWARIVESLVGTTNTIDQRTCEMTDQHRKDRKTRQNAVLAKIKNQEEQLKLTQVENERLQSEIGKVNQEIANRTRCKSKELTDKLMERRSVEKKTDAFRRKTEKRKKSADAIQRFLEEFGMSFGTSEDQEYFLQLQNLHPTCRDQSFCLCFSEFGGSSGKFIVERAHPSFREFQELAEEANRIQDLGRLIAQARVCWIRDIPK